jgi:hypothetical protein
VSGVVALMLEANPALSPDEVVAILRETATPMPFSERVVGAGYVDARNAVRAALALAPVAHPADLSAPDGTLVDVAGDQLGTTAHDIRSGRLEYDPDAQQVVYRLTAEDLSTRQAADRWTISSDFGAITIFVSAAVAEDGTARFTYGRIAPDPDTGVTTQTNLGAPDAGALAGDEITIRLSLDRINAAVGADVRYSRSTRTQAIAQVLIGSSVTGGLLLTADSSSGADFPVGTPPPPPPPASPGPSTRSFTERFAGSIAPGQAVDVPLSVRRESIEAKVKSKEDGLRLALIDGTGRVIATGRDHDDSRIRVGRLAAGAYTLRLSGAVSRATDWVISVRQSRDEGEDR